MSAPIPLVSWSASDEEWLAARRQGCGASDVAALLGFDSYRSPWQVWAEKTGHPLAPVRETSEAAELGHALEPWLIQQAPQFVSWPDVWADSTEARLYSHPEHDWRRCSPDAMLFFPSMLEDHVELVQAKTAGLITGRAPGWTDKTIPLGYELQARWELHVMDAEVNHVVALVAGRGLCHYPIVRDLTVEEQLGEQVDGWWQQHIVGGDEPPLGGRDGAVVAALYPRVARKSVQLDDTDALTYWTAYRDAHLDLSDAEARKAEAATALKALIGDAQLGLYDGRPIAAWGERKGQVNWQQLARELFAELAVLVGEGDRKMSDLDKLAEQFRGPGGRTFTIKE